METISAVRKAIHSGWDVVKIKLSNAAKRNQTATIIRAATHRNECEDIQSQEEVLRERGGREGRGGEEKDQETRELFSTCQKTRTEKTQKWLQRQRNS